MVDWIALGFVRLLSLFLQLLPIEAALSLGRGVGVFLAWTNHRRRLAYVNLKAAFGNRFNAEERKQIVRKLYAHLAQNVVEILCFPKLDHRYFERWISVNGRERYERVIRQNQGTVLITPHFGNWELSQVLSALAGKPLYVLARQQKYTRLDDFLNELRSAHGSVTIHKGGGVRDFIRTLQEGGLAGVLGDLSGGRAGSVVRFFGRKTTAPSGIFEIAKMTNSVVLPCFIVRLDGPRHQVFVEEPFSLVETGDEERDMNEAVQNYYRLLESWITKYPDQWLWVYKRWKHCFTKRVLILRDEQTGHTRQSEAVAREFERLKGSLPAEYEFEFSSIDVKFKSNRHRKLFFLLAFFIRPFAQGRLGVLNFFFESSCTKALQETHADLIISAGSSLAPLNLLLRQENLGKSIVLMKPSFPYVARFFDLLIIPVHDLLPKRFSHVVRTFVTPSRTDEVSLQTSADKLQKAVPLSSTGKKRISVFIGGKTKSYRFQSEVFRKWLGELRRCAEESDFELLVTTSRRTDPEISAMVKEELAQHPATKLLVIANEANFEDVTSGMLALSEVACVTEDSVSMISEAVSAGKNVLVMQLGNGKLSKKHSRFHKALETDALICLADAANFRAKLAALNGSKRDHVAKHQSKLIQEALRRLL